jgi:hypothetical protein
MAKEISKNISQQVSHHLLETKELLAINCKHHSFEANGLVVSLISILDTTDVLI